MTPIPQLYRPAIAGPYRRVALLPSLCGVPLACTEARPAGVPMVEMPVGSAV